MDQFDDMAKRSFGYGSWEARYWFLGPEQGMSRNEDLQHRYDAWLKLGSSELDDCRVFHHSINCTKWHAEKPAPQHTWTRLISSLVGYGAANATDRRLYQRDHWGLRDGDTCVIELSGLAANSLAEQRDRESYLDERLEKISKYRHANKPELIVLYGRTAGCRKAWDVLTAGATSVGQTSSGAAVHKVDRTLMTWTTHPANFGQTIAVWQSFGQELKHFQQLAA